MLLCVVLRVVVVVLCLCPVGRGGVCLWVLFRFVALALETTLCALSIRSRVCRENARVFCDTVDLTAHTGGSLYILSLSRRLSLSLTNNDNEHSSSWLSLYTRL